MSTPAISVADLGKSYRLGMEEKHADTFRDMLAGIVQAPFKRLKKLGEHQVEAEDAFWALRNVSFEVRPGEVVGIIGRNGAGKSTLLKILSRITDPTEGEALLRGRVSSLLEVGTGFHQELTGRENIFLNGSILGMTKAEIKGKFDEIVEFSEIEKFLDTPVKRYSSGMYVRLAFAVAAHLEPEILIVDEVLAVGDVAFQKKCLGKMKDISCSTDRAVLFVSHNMAAVEGLCNKCLVISKGNLAYTGDTRTAIAKYVESLEGGIENLQLDESEREGSGALRFLSVSVSNEHGARNIVGFGDDVEIVIDYTGRDDLKNVHMTVGIYDHLSVGLAWFSNELTGADFSKINKKGRFVCKIEKLPLMPGNYYLDLHCKVNGVLADWVKFCNKFTIIDSDFYGTGIRPHWGMITIPHKWELR